MISAGIGNWALALLLCACYHECWLSTEAVVGW